MITGAHARAQDWKPCEGPLKTRWAKDVSPNNALPEYPRMQGFTTDYEELPLTPEGRAALKPGKNVFAVHCHQTQGGQYIDVGIISLIEKP